MTTKKGFQSQFKLLVEVLLGTKNSIHKHKAWLICTERGNKSMQLNLTNHCDKYCLWKMEILATLSLFWLVTDFNFYIETTMPTRLTHANNRKCSTMATKAKPMQRN